LTRQAKKNKNKNSEKKNDLKTILLSVALDQTGPGAVGLVHNAEGVGAVHELSGKKNKKIM